MPDNQYQMIDLLEIFHARRLRDELQHEVRRLRCFDHVLPGSDMSRRQDVLAFYEGMLLTCTALLDTLGDEAA